MMLDNRLASSRLETGERTEGRKQEGVGSVDAVEMLAELERYVDYRTAQVG
jgi:hypothetical protein